MSSAVAEERTATGASGSPAASSVVGVADLGLDRGRDRRLVEQLAGRRAGAPRGAAVSSTSRSSSSVREALAQPRLARSRRRRRGRRSRSPSGTGRPGRGQLAEVGALAAGVGDVLAAEAAERTQRRRGRTGWCGAAAALMRSPPSSRGFGRRAFAMPQSTPAGAPPRTARSRGTASVVLPHDRGRARASVLAARADGLRAALCRRHSGRSVPEPRVVASGNLATPQLAARDRSSERSSATGCSCSPRRRPLPAARRRDLRDRRSSGPACADAGERLDYLPMRLSLVPRLFDDAAPARCRSAPHLRPARRARCRWGSR